MPHKHAPKVDVRFFEQVVTQLRNDLQALRATVADLECRVARFEHMESLNVPTEHNNTLVPRLERLEKIYVLVDFPKLQRVSEDIFRSQIARDSILVPCLEESGICCDDLIVIGDSPGPSPEQQGATMDLWDGVFGLLRGMGGGGDSAGHDTRGVDKLTYVSSKFGCDGDGQSLWQNMIYSRLRSAALVDSARRAWRAWEDVGQIGSLIILGSKRHLHASTLVESTQCDRNHLRGHEGQQLTTTANVAEVLQTFRSGIVLRGVGPRDSVMYGRAFVPGSTFHVVGYTFDEL